jgi:hypothetical protein
MTLFYLNKPLVIYIMHFAGILSALLDGQVCGCSAQSFQLYPGPIRSWPDFL